MQCSRLHQEFTKLIGEVHVSVQLEVQYAKDTLAKYPCAKSLHNQSVKYAKFHRKFRNIPADIQTALKGNLTSDDWLSSQRQKSDAIISIKPLEKWFLAHLRRPFPTQSEIYQLTKSSSLTMLQVQFWFCAARSRAIDELAKVAKRPPWTLTDTDPLESFVDEEANRQIRNLTKDF